jgi:hypothetical protein
LPCYRTQFVGSIEHSETHFPIRVKAMGFEGSTRPTNPI